MAATSATVRSQKNRGVEAEESPETEWMNPPLAAERAPSPTSMDDDDDAAIPPKQT